MLNSVLFVMASVLSGTVQKFAKHVTAKDTFSYPQERMSMSSREEEIRATLSNEEVARRIEKLGGVCDESNTEFDVYDQLLACEAIAESTPIISPPIKETERTVENVVTYGDGIGGCKQQVNFELTPDRLCAISKLDELDYRTPPLRVASLLEIIFAGYGTYEGWWLSVAQQWNPRAVRRALKELIKLQTGGWRNIKNPAKYYTFLIQQRKKRRIKKPIKTSSKNTTHA